MDIDLALVKAAYAAGYQRSLTEMIGWEPDSPDDTAPLGFEEWLAKETKIA